MTKISPRLLIGVLAVVFSVMIAGSSPPKNDWVFPRDQAEKWATRVRKLTPEGWTVTVRGNDIVIQRDQPVHFAKVEINAPPVTEKRDVRPLDVRAGSYQLTLRFAEKLSLDEYEKLAAVNAVSLKERDRLLAQTQLTHKFGELIATTPAEEARLKTYRAAEAKLVWHRLPDLYTPDYSIHLLRSWSAWSYVHDKDVAGECREVLDSVLKYFGMFDPNAATGRIDPGTPEP